MQPAVKELKISKLFTLLHTNIPFYNAITGYADSAIRNTIFIPGSDNRKEIVITRLINLLHTNIPFYKAITGYADSAITNCLSTDLITGVK